MVFREQKNQGCAILVSGHANGRSTDGNQLLTIDAPTSPVISIGAGARRVGSAMQDTIRDTFHETHGSGISERTDYWLVSWGAQLQ